MTEEIKTEEPKVEAFDPVKFKSEVAEMNRSYIDQAIEGVVARVTAANEEKAAKDVSSRFVPDSDKELEDFKTEIDELGLGEKEAKALTRLVSKAMARKAPDFERQVIGKIDQSLTVKDKKERSENEVMKKYPQVLDKTSTLWRKATERFNKLSDSIKNSPEGTSIAVELAAQDLGLKAVSASHSQSEEAQTAGGGGKETKITEDQVEFAKSFGVNAESFKRNLKVINSR